RRLARSFPASAESRRSEQSKESSPTFGARSLAACLETTVAAKRQSAPIEAYLQPQLLHRQRRLGVPPRVVDRMMRMPGPPQMLEADEDIPLHPLVERPQI